MALKWTNKAQGALNSSADRKLRISSLTKAIGLASVFGATTALSPAAQALKTDFGVEYRATGFYAQSDAFDVVGDPRNDNDNGFAHLIPSHRLLGFCTDDQITHLLFVHNHSWGNT